MRYLAILLTLYLVCPISAHGSCTLPSSRELQLELEALTPPPVASVAIIGSSTPRIMRERGVVMISTEEWNAGFGGARIRDIPPNFHILPQTITDFVLVSIGENDVAEGCSAREVVDSLIDLLIRLHNHYQCPVVFLAHKPTVERFSLWESVMRMVNAKMWSFAEANSWAHFVNANQALLRDGIPNPTMFDSGDLLHPNEAGMRAFGATLQSELIRLGLLPLRGKVTNARL